MEEEGHHADDHKRVDEKQRAGKAGVHRLERRVQRNCRGGEKYAASEGHGCVTSAREKFFSPREEQDQKNDRCEREPVE